MRSHPALGTALGLMAVMLVGMAWLVQGQVNRATAMAHARGLAAEATMACARAGSRTARNDCVRGLATTQSVDSSATPTVRLGSPIATAPSTGWGAGVAAQ